MRQTIKSAWLHLLQMHNISFEQTASTTPLRSTIKEDLVIFDPDILTDYPPVHVISVYLPDSIKV